MFDTFSFCIYMIMIFPHCPLTYLISLFSLATRKHKSKILNPQSVDSPRVAQDIMGSSPKQQGEVIESGTTLGCLPSPSLSCSSSTLRSESRAL